MFLSVSVHAEIVTHVSSLDWSALTAQQEARCDRLPP